MSRELGSSAATLLRLLFLDVCHCQAAPVEARAKTAMSAAATRPITMAVRRPRRGAAGTGSGSAPTLSGSASSLLNPVRTGSSEACAGTTGMTSVSGSGAGFSRRRGSSPEDPAILAIRSATVTPSVWLPVGASEASSSAVGTGWSPGAGPETGTSVEARARSHGAAPSAGRDDRVSQWLSGVDVPSGLDSESSSGVPGERRPGAALSPSLMSYRPPTVGNAAPTRAWDLRCCLSL